MKIGEGIVSNEEKPIVTPEAQRTLINNDLVLWRNTRFQMQMRYRVQKSLEKLGDVTDQLAAIETELARCEAAISTLETMLAEL
jgi:hypothetical protein